MNDKKQESPAEKLLGNVLELDESTSPREPGSPITQNQEEGTIQDEILRERVIEAIQTVYDPEIPINIYELGLIYDLFVEDGNAWIKMTLTSPACPVAETLPIEVENKVASVPGIKNVELEMVWDPPYNMMMMSEAARLQLGLL